MGATVTQGRFRVITREPAVGSNDDELMLACVVGDRGAFATLLERHGNRMFGFALRYCGQAALAEDITQDTFATLWELRERYEAGNRFSAFLAGICLNSARRVTRTRTRQQKRDDRMAAEPNTPPPELEADLIARERQRHVEQAVHSLPVRLREAVLLRFYENLSYAQIAELCSRSEEAMRARVFRAMKLLKKRIRLEAL